MNLLQRSTGTCCCFVVMSVLARLHAQPTGADVNSAIPISVGQPLQFIGDSDTRPHVVYAITLPANELFSMTFTRLEPWTSMGFDTVARVSLYAPGIQSVRVYNQYLTYAEVGDYVTSSVLNYYAAVTAQYYLDFEFFEPGISVQVVSSAQSFHVVQASGNDISALSRNSTELPF
jgi:hypothetical protein